MLSGYRSQYLTGNGLYCDVPKTPLYKGREIFLGNFARGHGPLYIPLYTK